MRLDTTKGCDGTYQAAYVSRPRWGCVAASDLILSRNWRIACVVLAVVPLPGLGVLVAGHRNPHTGYRNRGIAQMLLVLFGSWPLVVPGVIGLAWAVYDAVQIHRTARPPGDQSKMVPVTD